MYVFLCRALVRPVGYGLLLYLLVVPPAAAEETLRGSHVFAFERSPNTAGDGGSFGQQKELGLSAVATTRLDYRLNRGNGDQLRLAQWFESELFPEHQELDRFSAETRASYWTQFSKDTQIRLQAAHSYVRDRGQMVFFRPRFGVQIRHRHDPQHLSRVRLRLGYRDQNEATFRGFDQMELGVELGHDWRAEDRELRFSATAFGEYRVADEERFSYIEGSIRLNARYPLADDLMLHGRLEGSSRLYAGDFSAAIAERRRDFRVRGSLQLGYDLTYNVALTGSVGWDRTASTINLRTYEGPTFGLGLEVSGLLWERD